MPTPDVPAAPAAQRRALVLLNPNARQGKANIDGLLDRMEDQGLRITVESSLGAGDLSDTIIARRDTVDCVVVCGGDGTINAAARGLMETRLPMGILPMGTANDLARTLGVPPDLQKAADIIVAGRTNAIDVGSVNGHPFFNVASMGLSADLARGLTRETKRRWGRLGYAVAASRVLMQARPFTAWISNRDERIRVKTMQIAVGNGRHYGGGNVVEQSAAIDDGMLDLYSLELRNVAKLAMMLRSFRQGAHGAWDEVRTKRCVEFDIETRTPRPINTDGELVTETPAHFKVHREAVIAYVPAPPATPSL
jgi:diacylglycerol kinase (ATP)